MNVTVNDTIASDFVNYTLMVIELIEIPTDNTGLALFFMVGFIPFLLSIGIGFWKEQGALLMIGGIIGILLGIWVLVAIYFVFGLSFIGISMLFMYMGWVNTETGGM